MKIFYLFLMIIILIATAGYLAIFEPWKITDPADSRFDPVHFSYGDYKSEKELQTVLTKLFPKGTERTDVEDILIGSANLDVGYTEGDGGNYYITYANFDKAIEDLSFFDIGIRQAQFEYDSSDKVVSIKSHIINGKTPPKFFIGEKIDKGARL